MGGKNKKKKKKEWECNKVGGEIELELPGKNSLNLLNITMTDPERSKGRKEGSKEVRKKLKVQSDKKPKMP